MSLVFSYLTLTTWRQEKRRRRNDPHVDISFMPLVTLTEQKHDDINITTNERSFFMSSCEVGLFIQPVEAA